MNTGAALRDAGIETVMANAQAWADEVEHGWRFWLQHHAPDEFTLEQFRMWVTPHIGEPHHPNAWGGLAKRFASDMKHTGFTTSARPQAHARLTRTYRRA